MHLVRYVVFASPFLLVAFLLAYVIWFRRVVLEIPVALRLVLSAVPGFVGYRAVRALYLVIAYRKYLAHSRFAGGGLQSPWLVGFLAIVTAIAGVVLYQIWRDVKLDDFKYRERSDCLHSLEDSEFSSGHQSSSRGKDKLT